MLASRNIKRKRSHFRLRPSFKHAFPKALINLLAGFSSNVLGGIQLITQGYFSYFSSFKQDLPSPQIVTTKKNMLPTGRLVREIKVRHVYEHERLKTMAEKQKSATIGQVFSFPFNIP